MQAVGWGSGLVLYLTLAGGEVLGFAFCPGAVHPIYTLVDRFPTHRWRRAWVQHHVHSFVDPPPTTTRNSQTKIRASGERCRIHSFVDRSSFQN